jgi:hypothetical protein
MQRLVEACMQEKGLARLRLYTTQQAKVEVQS